MPESQIQVKLNPDVPPTGSDLAVVNAARRSFNSRSEWDWYSWEDFGDPKTPPEHEMIPHLGSWMALKPRDKRLIQFLARGMTADDFEEFKNDISNTNMGCYWEKNKLDCDKFVELIWQWRNTPTHGTPFNHCFISFEVKAPIFVARQLVKHEYLVMSEFSRRYITDDIEFYEPDYWRKAAPNKKQGSLEESVEKVLRIRFASTVTVDEAVEEYREYSLDLYKELLDHGVAPEQARGILPQDVISEWTWSGTLGAFAKMCQLRLHHDAQYETRLIAQEVYKCLKDYYPVSAKALVEGPDV